MKFKDTFRIEYADPEHTFLLTERNSFVMRGQLFQRLVPFLNGQRSIEEVLKQICPDLDPELSFIAGDIPVLTQVQYALLKLQSKGYLVQNESSLPPDLAVFCGHLGIDFQLAYSRLQSTTVAVRSFGSNLPVAQFITLLEAMQIQVNENAVLEVILTDDYLQDGLSNYNQTALNSLRPWMLVKPTGTIAWIGPIFRPNITGCWQCLAQRLQNNRPVEEFVQRKLNLSTPLVPPLTALPSALQTALGIAATELFKWIVSGENKRLEGMLVTHDALALETQNHILTKRPQCSACGQNSSRGLHHNPLPIVLGHRKKSVVTGGTHRSIAFEETLAKFQNHISPITGVIRELKPLNRISTTLIHSYLAKHHFATLFDDLDALCQYTVGRSGGTAQTDSQARCSAFCEALERYSGVFQGDEIRQRGSYQQMEGKAIPPNLCMNFSQTQLQNRHQWNAECSGLIGDFQRIPEPFDEAQEIEWTPVWSLTQRQFKYLPTAYCYYGYPALAQPSCWADSNGCAAGNTLEEAIAHGFMELVERDCVALWWYNRLTKPQVDLDGFDEPYFQALQAYYQTINREFWLLDITSDLNIPAFAAISRRTDREVEDIIFDFGADFDPKTAIFKALNGMNKLLHAVTDANPDGSTRYHSVMSQIAINWWKTARLSNQAYLTPDANIPAKRYSDFSWLQTKDLLEDVMLCQQIVEQKGMELLVLDQTRPDIGLKVVKVVVPGLRHFWKRLGPGRLYDVPVQLGWLKAPLREDQLNSVPMWM